MLTFQVQGTEETISVEPRRLVMAGFTGRDQRAVQAHIDEMREHGVAAPTRVPIVFPCTVDRLTMEPEIEVLGGHTSGEAEFVLVYYRGQCYVAAGSDHTDREHEKASIVFSKQACPKVVSRELWPFADIRDRWDDVEIRGIAGDRDGYQQSTVGQMLRPEALEQLVLDRLGGGIEGTIIYSGTPAIADGGGFAFGAPFTAELRDPATGRALRCAYTLRETALTDVR